jgi:hypothetical protein
MNIGNDGRFPKGPTTSQILSDREAYRCAKIWGGLVSFITLIWKLNVLI